MSATAEATRDERLEFAADVPFVRRVLDTDEKADQYTSLFGEKLPNAQPKAAKGDAVLNGYANTWVKDRDQEFVAKRAFDNTLEAYLRKNPIILLQHNHDWPLGQVMDGGTDETGLGVEGYVRQPKDKDPDWKHGAYNDVIAGILRTMSIGGFFYREIVDGEILVVEIDLFEISVVAVPSNPDSIFEATRKAALGLDTGSRVGESMLLEQMQQLLGMTPVTDPALAGLPDRFRRAKYYELASQYTKTFQSAPPEYEEWGEISKKLDSEAPDAKALQTEVGRFLDRLIPQPKAGKAVSAKAPAAVTEKAGRVLSKSNESKIRGAADKIKEAADSLQAVLDKLPEEGEQAVDGELVGKALADLKGAFGQVFNAYELSDALYDGYWALRTAIERALALYDQDAEPDLEAVVEACNEFRDWLVDKARILSSDVAQRAAMGEDMRVLAAVLGERQAKKPAEIVISLEV